MDIEREDDEIQQREEDEQNLRVQQPLGGFETLDQDAHEVIADDGVIEVVDAEAHDTGDQPAERQHRGSDPAGNLQGRTGEMNDGQMPLYGE